MLTENYKEEINKDLFEMEYHYTDWDNTEFLHNMLNEVTVQRDHHEFPWVPDFFDLLAENAGFQTLRQDFQQYQDNTKKRIRLIRQIAQRKLKGNPKICLLLLLATGASYKQIAELLAISVDTVSRALQTAVSIICECLHAGKNIPFHTSEGNNLYFNFAIFPSDTPQQRNQLQTFFTKNTLVFTSYSGDDRIKEVLVVFLDGKERQNPTNDSTISSRENM